MKANDLLLKIKKSLKDNTVKYEEFGKVNKKRRIYIQVNSKKGLNAYSVCYKYQVALIEFDYKGKILKTDNDKLDYLIGECVDLSSFKDNYIRSGWEHRLRVGYINAKGSVHIYNKRDLYSMKFDRKKEGMEYVKIFQSIIKENIKNVSFFEICHGNFFVKILKDDLFLSLKLNCNSDDYYSLKINIRYKDVNLELRRKDCLSFDRYFSELESNNLSNDLKVILIGYNTKEVDSYPSVVRDTKDKIQFNMKFKNKYFNYLFELNKNDNTVVCKNSRSVSFIPSKIEEINKFISKY